MSRLYLEAGNALEKMIFKKVGMKEAVYSSGCPSKQKPALMGLVSKAFQNQTLLHEALSSVGAFTTEVKMRRGLLLVMTTELLLGSGKIRGGGHVKRFLIERMDALKEHVSKSGTKINLPQQEKNPLPRYLRVNMNRFKTLDAAVSLLKKSGVSPVAKDPHIPSLLVASNKDTKILVDLDAVKKGDIILQDKSTCVSAFCLLKDRPKSSAPIHVVDACSAPGGKTLHILEQLRSGDRLTAVELDPKRAKVLEQRLATLGEMNKGVKVQVIQCDFLKLFQDDARLETPVTHINLDPSCSGSGMDGPSTKGKDKLKNLASFQSMMLRHALNGFDKAEVVCYSTCSVEPVENEQVVSANLNDKFIIDKNPLPAWWTSTCEDGFIRTSPKDDNCRGFFLAKLVRRI
jgi:16S rRNA C967 or C1407 C5-methylase (RsmB/RsmF family)